MAFPRHTQQFHIQDLSAWRRLALSLPWFGVLIGVVVRLYRWGAFVLFPTPSGAQVLALLLVGVAVLFGLSTLHLANYTLRAWRFRAPLLGAFVAVGEAATSLVLTLAGQERIARMTATLADWPSSAIQILVSRVVVISLFALALAAAVIVLRRADLANETPR